MLTVELCKEIAAGTLHSTGQGIQWQKLLSRKPLRLGFIGGSVTMGYSKEKGQEKPYPIVLCERLQEQGIEAQPIFCAEPGMTALHGCLLAEELILSQKPDLVFLEFAINETNLKPSVMAFESLLRKLLTAPDAPAVGLFILRNTNDYSCESYMLPIAEHYGLPCVRLRTGLNPLLERGVLQWSDYADDESHPYAAGHEMLAECLLHLFAEAKAAPETEPRPLPEPWLDVPFAAMRFLHPRDCTDVRTEAEIVSRYSLYFPEGWKLTKAHPDWELTVTARTLILFYEVHFLPEFGSAEITLDGVPFDSGVLHGNSMYGWGNTRFAVLFSGEEPETHTLRLKHLDSNFFIPALGICD